MKITYADSPATIPFNTVPYGTLFRTQDNRGLFLRIKPIRDASCSNEYARAIVIESITAGISPGSTTGWVLDGQVILVTTLSIGTGDQL